MKALFSQILAGAVALTAFSILGCGSSGDNPSTAPGSGGGQGGAIASSSSESAGGATTSPTSSAPASGGTPATAGQSQASSVPQGGSASGGAVTSATSTLATGGSAGGGGASGGGSAKGGSVADAGVIGGSPTDDAAAGGRTTAGGSIGAPDGAATGGKMTTDGAAGGIVTGGTSAAGGSPPLGGGKGSSNGTTPITVWMAGDSTMSGSGCDGGGWGDQFGSVFNSNVTVQNKSVAGRSIQTWLYEKNVSSTAGANGECTLTATTYSDNWNSMLTGMKAGDWLFIEFGINDGDGTCPRHVGTALFQTYLTTMAKAASDRGAQAVFLTSTSAIACNGSTAQANRGFGPQTKAAGAADNVPVIDVTTLSAALYTSLGLCPNSNDYTSTTSKVGQFFCNDHTHFEKAGGLQIAQMVGKALKDQGIGLAAYLAN